MLTLFFYSRRQESRDFEQKAAAQRRAQDARTVQAMGGDRFAILGLYANPATIHSGDTADICYSVSNAKTVTLQPQNQPVWPAFSHCAQVAPRKTTSYAFTAQDAAGHTKIEVKVRADTKGNMSNRCVRVGPCSKWRAREDSNL